VTLMTNDPAVNLLHPMKRLRLERGWTQTVLAYHSGVSARCICSIESGQHQPRLTQCAKLLRALGLTYPDDITLLWPERRREA
jgi:DNA-binding XRE family transcriptional regulator